MNNSNISNAVEWYCSNYLKITGTNYYKNESNITLENFVRAMENKVMFEKSCVLESPVKIEWHITKKCNLSCPFCYANANNSGIDELSTEETLNIIQQIHQANVLEIQIEGGEPFLRTDLDQILTALKSHPTRIRLLTNGTIINPKVLDVVQKKFTRDDVLQISIHGYDDTTHDANVHCQGAFRKVVRFLRMIQSMGITARVSCVVNNQNIHYLDKMIYFLSEFDCINSFVMQPIIPIGRGDLQSVVSSKELLLKYYELSQIPTKINLSMLLGHAYDIPELADYIMRNGIEEKRIFCAASRARLHINEYGDVYPCHFLAYPEFYLGSLRKTNLLNIWHSDENKKVQGYSKAGGECDKCTMKHHCTKKGLCTSFLNEKNILSQPINCFVSL